jgi:hypothetical protein
LEDRDGKAHRHQRNARNEYGYKCELFNLHISQIYA